MDAQMALFGVPLESGTHAAPDRSFLRYLRQDAPATPELERLRPELDTISETELVSALLLHDLGKHAAQPAFLNAPALGREELLPRIGPFYRFHESIDDVESCDLLTAIMAISDIYEALTAPKLFK